MTEQPPPGFYYGTSNVELPVPNKTHFPAEFRDKSRLCFYASIFNSVEVNSSFYKIPMKRTTERWASEVPEAFRFTLKLWGGITHAKELAYDRADISRFLEAASGAGDKKGCLLIQFPASIRYSLFARFKRLIDELGSEENVKGWRLAVEFRDKSWYRDDVYQFLEHYGANVVIHDMPKSATPLIDMDTETIYLRFHGEKGDYRGSYATEELQDHAYNIKEWIAEGKTVFAYFNNTMGEAVFNAMALGDIVRA